MRILQSSSFQRFVKKQTSNFKQTLDSEIKKIIKNPNIGELKKGDLSHVRVHKFKHNKTVLLLAYTEDEKAIQLIMLGQHENYYKNLKQYIKKWLNENLTR